MTDPATSPKRKDLDVEIRPGDEVEYKSRWCRVIEVYPPKSKLKIYRTSAVQSSVETVFEGSITDYRGRDDGE